jgi:hypothetical protein
MLSSLSSPRLTSQLIDVLYCFVSIRDYYGTPITMARGMLTFKGDAPKKKKKKQKHAVAAKKEEGDTSVPAAASIVTTAATVTQQQPQHATAAATITSQIAEAPQIKTGSGKITTSGTVVTGIGTKFEKEIAMGDAMIVVLGNGKQEMRVVKMRLSDMSCGISSAFSSSLMTPTSYQIIRKPKNAQADAKQKREETQKEREELEMSAFGTFRGTNELVYRERTEHGSYRIEKVGLDGDRSRTQLLAMRAKKTSDKYC